MSYSHKKLMPLNENVYQNNKLYFDSMKEILIFSETIIDDLNKLKLTTKHIDDFKKLILYFFFKATAHGKSIWLLASDGQFIESSIILRSAIELYIHVKYVIANGTSQYNALAKEFFDYLRFKERKRYYLSLDITREFGPKKMEKIIKNKINELNFEFINKKESDFWPGRKVSVIAKNASLKRFYQTVYDSNSKYVHMSVDNLYNYFNPEKNIWILYTPSNRVHEILVTFYDIYLQMINILADTFWRHPFESSRIFAKKLVGLQKQSLELLDY